MDFTNPEQLDDLFFVRDIRFSSDKQSILYVVSPTNKEARQQEMLVSVFNDPSVDKAKLTKLLGNKDDVVRLCMVREKDADHCFAYFAEAVQKDNKVMDVDSDGRKRLAFTWTQKLDDHVDKWHGFEAKAQAAQVLASLVEDNHAQGSISARAMKEANLLAQELNPGANESTIAAWMEQHFQGVAKTGDILNRGTRDADGVERPLYFNTDYTLAEQCDLPNMQPSEKRDHVSAFVWQKALQQEIVECMTRPVVKDGKEISPHLAREASLVENGLLYAPNPTLNDELRQIKGREIAERESGKSVRCAMAFLGGISASGDHDDVRVGEKTTDNDGVVRNATIGGEIVDRAISDGQYGVANSEFCTGDREKGTADMVRVLAGSAAGYCEHEASKVLYGKSHGIIAEQDENGAVENGFSRRHIDIEKEKEKAAEKLKERGVRIADIGVRGMNDLIGDDGPTHNFVK